MEFNNLPENSKMAGFDWLKGFRKRNLTTMIDAGGLSWARCSGLSQRDVSEYFSLLWETVEKFGIMNKRERLWNAEGSGCQLNNRPTKKKVSLEGKRSHVLKNFCELGELVTVMACWSADVSFIPPVTMFRGRKYRSEFGGGFSDCSLATMTDSGWVNEKCLHDLVTSVSDTPSCRTMTPTVRWPQFSYELASSRLLWNKNKIAMVCLSCPATNANITLWMGSYSSL